MKRYLNVVLIGILAGLLPGAASAQTECAGGQILEQNPRTGVSGCVSCPDASTQSGMNACAHNQAESADAELNRIYDAILTRNRGDKTFTDKLKAAQRAWLKFRDAEVKARFPEENDPKGTYGSVYPMCISHVREELTRARTTELQKWLEGREEGDVCSGSYPRKQ
jgi:uncharacterized protein YecT (DUF1311 family)